MQCGENNSLSVIVIMKFNHILNCNHEVVIKQYRTNTCICQDLLCTPTYELRMDCEI